MISFSSVKDWTIKDLMLAHPSQMVDHKLWTDLWKTHWHIQLMKLLFHRWWKISGAPEKEIWILQETLETIQTQFMRLTF